MERGGYNRGGGGGGGGYRGRGGGYRGGYGGDGPSFKRKRQDDPNVDPTNPDPSIVVHVRNLSPKATEADLLEALSHFGPIAYATCMPNKHMALVEFEDVEGARSCVVYAQTNQIYVAGQPALFNYSTSKMIQRLGLESEIPNHVLIATIFNVQYPITVDVVHQIVKAHGECRRIAILKKQMLQALIEMESVEAAKKVKHALNGADIYSGCCTLKVEYAKPDYVKVTRNDQDQFDFTIKMEPGAQMMPQDSAGRKTLLGDAQGSGNMGQGPPGNMNNMQGPPGGGMGGGNMGMMNNMQNMPANQMAMNNMNNMNPMANNIPNNMGGPPNMNNMNNGPPNQGYNNNMMQGNNQYNNGPYNNGPQQGGYNQGSQGYNQGGGNNTSGGGNGYQGQPSSYDRQGGGGYGGNDLSPVVMVYGIDQGKINCEKLFNLLCLYGNVLKIKFMKSKPDTSMVQMGSVEQVQTAIEFLHGAFLFDQKLALRPSKQTILHDIRDPFELPDGSASFVDFTGNRNQRWDTPQAAARNRVVRPCATLHWYNAPPEMTPEMLKEMFERQECPMPVQSTLFPSKSDRSSSGVCEFETVEASTEALVKANHTPVDSTSSSMPYILKLAYAGGRDGRDFKH